MQFDQLFALLQSPPNRYRPIPFWSWNERLDVDETRRQIAEMERVGIGGYFMHARGGLQTEYMGEEWMANVTAGIDEARQRDMGAWVYDENGWPSGFGDGRVNGHGLAFQQKYLRIETVTSSETDERTITVIPQADGSYLRLYFDVNPLYIDILDREVVATFLQEIHEQYAEKFGADFGKAMPGFFTDEPQVSRDGIPWSFTMPEQYRAAYGEELLPLLPQLFRAEGDYQRTRYRFWHLVQELFVTNFTQQIYDWCEAHHCQLTGHMVLEETLHSQLTSNGAVMPNYEFFHLPGIDWLTRCIDPATTPLQLASVVHQLGRRYMISETFALSGWNVMLEELKWMFEWQSVRGITQMCQHLEGYSLRGIRKRDYPPSLFYQQPWWGEAYRTFNDAMTRLGMLLAEGDVQFDLLVLHPQSSAWLCYNDVDNPGLNNLQDAFMALTDALEAAHVPFHYGDERILRRHGAVAEGALQVGTQRYHAVIVPPCLTLDASTVVLLQQFAATGGTIIWLGQQPTRVAGQVDPTLAQLIARGTTVSSNEAAISALPAAVRRIPVRAADGQEIGRIAATRRRMGDVDIYFFANADQEHEYAAQITLPGRVAARFVLEDGTLAPVQYTAQDGQLQVRYTFPQRGSLMLFVAEDNALLNGIGALPAPAPVGSAIALDHEEWELALLDPNAFTLDVCDYWLDGELVEHEHISTIQWRCLQQQRPVDVKMRFTVQAAPDFAPAGELFLVVEQPASYDITINGQPLAQRDAGHYRDTSFRKLDITGLLHPGTNEIVLHTTFTQPASVYENLKRAAIFESEKNKLTYQSEIEAIYLIGQFGVATPGEFTPLPRHAMRYHGDFQLTTLPRTAPATDLVRHGLPFFNGTVRLTKRITGTKLTQFKVTDAQAHVVRLAVNGQAVGNWLWRPYTADLSSYLQAGENEITLELTTGLRNLLGPHHLEEGESYAVGPHCFFKEPNIWGCSPWNNGYCFTEFGVK